ncbi:MAG: aspartate/glutamate racemase family protein [Aeromicrobium erythreum]
MRTIGLLGGMSWESTAEYYRVLNETVRERLGGHHSAPVLMDSVDFAGIERRQAAGAWDELGTILARRARTLQDAGAELVLLATNTMHLVADVVQDTLDVPFLHIGDVTAAAARAAGASTVGLLGTRFTMEHPFMVDHLAARGVASIVPEADDRELVHGVIYDELVRGDVREESRIAYRGVIERLVARGAQAVVLGCTEIELLVGPADSAVTVLPTTRLHAEAAVEAALG